MSMSQSTLWHFQRLHRSNTPHWARVLSLLEGCAVPADQKQNTAGHLEHTSASWTTHGWNFWVAKEAVSEKIVVYILALLLELVWDYWVAKSSFQKVEARKEERRNLLILCLVIGVFTQEGRAWDGYKLFKDIANSIFFFSAKTDLQFPCR